MYPPLLSFRVGIWDEQNEELIDGQCGFDSISKALQYGREEVQKHDPTDYFAVELERDGETTCKIIYRESLEQLRKAVETPPSTKHAWKQLAPRS